MTGLSLPREHGAYGQLAFPLVTALLVAGISIPALAFVTAVVAAFLAHEPLLIVLGHRGPRPRREEGRSASIWVGVLGLVALTAAATAMAMAAPAERWWLLLPGLPATVVAVAIARNREKSAAGEIASGLSFAFAAAPATMLGGGDAPAAVAIAATFALISMAQIMAVRVVILRVRAGGDAHAVRTTRAALTLVIAAGMLLLALVGAEAGFAPLIAAAPSCLVAMVLALRPPKPSRLKAVGWTLVGSSTVAAMLLIAAAG